MGFGRCVCLSPTLTSIFISSVKSSWGEEGERLTGKSWLGLEESGSSLLLRLGGTPLWREDGSFEDSYSWHTFLVCSKLISGSSSSLSEGCLISCFGLPRLSFLGEGTDMWCTEKNML